jgi:putative cardiolipin synthase
LFNPVASRTRRMLSSIADFGRVNRRMHNKSLTADNTLSIVGGRNIGNEYFDANNDIGFADLDVIAVGPVVDEVTDSFDLYWNYPASYAIESLSGRTLSEAEITEARQEARQLKAENEASDYAKQLRIAEFLQNPQSLNWYWGIASLVYDHPAKATGSIDDSERLLSRMALVIDAVQS